ncbi:MAG TPA: RHS repeat-associated core domain-containing protein [Dehalococcoidia bacterium]|nr:RHS repeat-associated core domain-containing protein [Dehalococcoidia bacterium]
MKARRAAGLIAILLTLIASDSGGLPSLPTWVEPVEAQVVEKPASGALRPAPLNNTFDADPETVSPGKLDSLGQETGPPPSWEVSKGEAMRDRDGPTESFALLEGSEATLTSDAFTVAAATAKFSFRYRFQEEAKANVLKVYVLSGPDFDDEELAATESCNCANDWQRTGVDVRKWAGQNVKVKFALEKGAVSPVAIDDVATDLQDAQLGRKRGAAMVADPVNTSTGNFTLQRTDIAPIAGKGVPLGFTRFYNSEAAESMDPGTLGIGWSHNYAWSMDWVSWTDGFTNFGGYDVTYPDGHVAFFWTLNEPFDYEPPPGGDTICDDWCLETKGQVQYEFDDSGYLISITDRNGNVTTVEYSSTSPVLRLSQVTDSSGRSLDFTTNSDGLITQVTDPLNRSVTFSYTTIFYVEYLTSVGGSNGGLTYAYTSSGVPRYLKSETDQLNHKPFENTYSQSHVVEQKDALGNITCFLYYGINYSTNCEWMWEENPAAGSTIVGDPLQNMTTYFYDSNFQTTQIVDALEGVTQIDIDWHTLQPSEITDPLNQSTSYDYDNDSGNLLTKTDALDNEWTFEYTSTNDVELATDPLGRMTDFAYDGAGNLIQVTDKDASSVVKRMTCYTRPTSGSNKGLVTEEIESTTLTDCTGNKTKFEYDSYGNVTGVINARFSSQGTPPKATLTYDAAGRVLTATNELSHTATWTYNNLNEVLTVKDHLNNTTTSTFDAVGNLKTVKDALNNTTTYNYDAANRLTSVIDSASGTTTYMYDANGNRLSATSAKRAAVSTPESGSACGSSGTGNGSNEDSDSTADDGCPSVIYTYDELNRLETITDPLVTTTLTYDDASRLIQRDVGSSALRTKYFYDVINQNTSIEHWNGGAQIDTWTLTFDEVGNRTQTVDDSGTTNYAFDALNRLQSVTFPGGKQVQYQYDNVGNHSQLTYHDAKTVDYAYDEANKLTTVTDWASNVTTYAYDNAGQLTGTTLPLSTSVTTTYGYDNADRLTSVENKKSGTAISKSAYTLNAVGNRTQLVITGASGAAVETQGYSYDALHRLTQATYTVGSQTDNYTYDANGNRLTKNSSSFTYGAADEMLTAGGVSYGYDIRGNQTSRGSDSFTWDHENRMTSATIAGATSNYTYNIDGLRTDQNGATVLETTVANTTVVTSHSFGSAATWTPPAGMTEAFDVASQATPNSAGVSVEGNYIALAAAGPIGIRTATASNDADNGNTQALALKPASGQTIAFRAASSAGAASGVTSLVVNKPSGVAQNDVMVASIAVRPKTAVITPPSGWTLVRRSNNSNSNTNSLAVYTKVAGSSEPSSYTWTFDTSTGSAGGIQAFSGVDTTTPVNVETGHNSPSGLTHAAGAVIDSSSYVWDVASSPPVVLWDSSGGFFIYGIGVIGWKSGSNFKYALHDGLGSTTEVLNADGTVNTSYTYDVFGAARSISGGSGNDFKFTGEQQDDESGYHYLRARYYDDAAGRFISADPAEADSRQPGTINRFIYVGGNPSNLTDPTGLFWICGNPYPPGGVPLTEDNCYWSTDVGLPGMSPVSCIGFVCLFPDGTIYDLLNPALGQIGYSQCLSRNDDWSCAHREVCFTWQGFLDCQDVPGDWNGWDDMNYGNWGLWQDGKGCATAYAQTFGGLVLAPPSDGWSLVFTGWGVVGLGVSCPGPVGPSNVFQ